MLYFGFDVANTSKVLYARADGVDIAYRVHGDGPFDVAVFPALISHLDFADEMPPYSGLVDLVGDRIRLILFDRRGAGLSHRGAVGSPEERMDDLRIVLDAVGSERAAVVGLADGGLMSIAFATTYPERVTALVLQGASARWIDDPATGYDVGFPRSLAEEAVDDLEQRWGTGETIASIFGQEPAKETICARWERNIGTPSEVRSALRAFIESDVRSLLPRISCPTLVVHSTWDPAIAVANGRYLGAHIPGAVYTELPFTSIGLGADADVAAQHIVRFLLGDKEPVPTTRLLATVLFVDLVESTASMRNAGDTAWRRVLDQFEGRCADVVDVHGGQVVKHTGDGTLALFPGPGRAVRAAHVLQREADDLGLELRAGLHAGEVEMRGNDIGGIAVTLANRIQSCAGAHEVLVSRTITDLTAGSELRFETRGRRDLKGFAEPQEVFISEAPR